MPGLVLSLFPGLDLLGRGFEAEGWCVVRGPDVVFGGDIRTFCPPLGAFEGIIGGPPCQDFADCRRAAPTGAGAELLGEFVRCVEAARPAWWLLENVRAVPDVRIAGYSWQRLDLRASDYGLPQRRLRHFQFGHAAGDTLVVERPQGRRATEEAALASEGQRGARRRSWAAFCALQGLEPVELPGWTLAARYRAVGNGVPVPVARALAAAIRSSLYPAALVRACRCGCGRSVRPGCATAGPACRKREERRRRGGAPPA